MPSLQFHPSATPGDTLFEKLFVLDRVRALYQKLRAEDRPIPQALLEELNVTCRVAPDDLAKIPKSGPVVAVANHPFGMLEGGLLGSLIPRVRTDFKVVTSYLLAGLPELEPNCIFVDPFQAKDSSAINRRALRQALGWLRSGGMLVIFPAGEVSHWMVRNGRVADPRWNTTAAGLMRLAKAPGLPIFFKGVNSVPFHLLGTLHPSLRTLSLPNQLLNKRGKTVEVRVGRLVPYRSIAALGSDAGTTEYLRWRTYLLEKRSAPQPIRVRPWSPKKHAIAPRFSPAALSRDVASLPPDALMARSGDLSVFLAAAHQIPAMIEEIGRMREVTFRSTGEGTGHSRDLDSFDAYYHHLFLWSESRQELAGAYRLGYTDEILPSRGIDGLYTSTLFDFDPRLFDALGPSIELGRSFIAGDYQKQYAPLLMLWKGIMACVARRPGTPVLFGPVSVSNEYSPSARRLIARYLESRNSRSDLNSMVRPRRPLRDSLLHDRELERAAALLQGIEGLSDSVADIEPDGKGLPVLLKQYLKLGGEVLAFNVDQRFANALDGLLVVDLRKTNPAILARLQRGVGTDSHLAHVESH